MLKPKKVQLSKATKINKQNWHPLYYYYFVHLKAGMVMLPPYQRITLTIES